MTFSNGNIFRVTGPLCGETTGPGEFTTQRPVTRSFDAFFDLRLNKRLSKHSWGWWFETLSLSLWRHHNGLLPGDTILLQSICISLKYHLVYGWPIASQMNCSDWIQIYDSPDSSYLGHNLVQAFGWVSDLLEVLIVLSQTSHASALVLLHFSKNNMIVMYRINCSIYFALIYF